MSTFSLVLSSRVRLARNAKAFPFVEKLSPDEQEKIINMSKKALIESNTSISSIVKFFEIRNIDNLTKQNLIEKHLISPKLAIGNCKNAAIISNNEEISIMINEEDHFRIQCMKEGFDLFSCLNLANKIDDLLEENIEFGFDEQFGYLTHCPTNAGTGMRASVMVHLPLIVASSLMDKLVTSLSQLGMTIRGIYGEGSKALGNIFQISNQVTLGISEAETIEKLNHIVNEVIDQEKKAEEIFYTTNKYKVKDAVMRALGTLRYAEYLSNEEFLLLISSVTLGMNLEIIKEFSYEKITKLRKDAMSSEITKKYGSTNQEERDVKRAEIVRETLNDT